MKLLKYNDLLNEERGEDKDMRDDEFGDETYYGGEDEETLYVDNDEENEDEDEIDYEDASQKDILENLASLIRKMIANTRIENYYVTVNDFDITVQFVLKKEEKFTKFLEILGLLKKLTTDTLIQYESELDLWETKDNLPLLTVDFYYDNKKAGSFNKF